jgi:ABC-type glycerol-3-phosphate transport system permease component
MTTTTLAPKNKRSRQEILRIIGLVILQIVMTIILITFLVPTLWMISSSLKVSTEVFVQPIKWIPDIPQWGNYNLDAHPAFASVPFSQFAWNTLMIVVFAVGGTVVSSVLTAYAFSRLNWPGKNFFFALMIATIMLPEIITLIPRFILFRTFDQVTREANLDEQLGLPKIVKWNDFMPIKLDRDITIFKLSLRWIDSALPLTAPSWFAVTALYVFLIQQFFRGIPKELEEAALIDGANRLQILTQILLPLSKPVIATVTVFSLIQHYNEFLTPLIYLNKMDNWVMALGIRALNNSQTANWEIVFAASTLMLIPVLIVFVIAQRYFVQGIAMTGFGGR